MPETTRVSQKGQATIPQSLREKFDIEPGDQVVWWESDDGIVLKKREPSSGRGMLVPDDTTEEEREAVAATLAEEIRDRRDSEWTE
ncbi:AbrB family transcription regulator [Halovivax asiaticus JCM 14624]|uniref:AbrB family transcription regulator n=1 Tax=Halovivax asiaticus JCM 14624 TaxID=1227490 RepID=M0BP31_9EURY|nr:AbrB/MazE/SpoVT family DNA-binding domain-containing protein [Halovivax asiaticus]ELZ12242.1 AbrB family transcription regulator [Halovivax asiaticus JCM 14624]